MLARSVYEFAMQIVVLELCSYTASGFNKDLQSTSLISNALSARILPSSLFDVSFTMICFLSYLLLARCKFDTPCTFPKLFSSLKALLGLSFFKAPVGFYLTCRNELKVRLLAANLRARRAMQKSGASWMSLAVNVYISSSMID